MCDRRAAKGNETGDVEEKTPEILMGCKKPSNKPPGQRRNIDGENA